MKTAKRSPKQTDAVDTLTTIVAECEAQGMTRKAIAESMGAPQPMLNQWLARAIVPGAVYRQKIEAATGGRIPVSAWLDADDHKSIAAVRPLPASPSKPSARLASVVPAPPKTAA